MLIIARPSTKHINNKISIDVSKSNIVRLRNESVVRSNFVFVCDSEQMQYMSQNEYVGIVLTELTAEIVAQSANRTLGHLTTKSKSFGGFPYKAFTKLFESPVIPVITYGASIWG